MLLLSRMHGVAGRLFKGVVNPSIWRSEAGGVTLLVAFAVPVFVGALGVGIDTGAWYIEKRKVQQVADAAALGAARALSAGQNATTAQAIGARDAARNGYVAATGSSITINTPPTTGTYKGNTGAAEAIVVKQLPSLFSGYFLGSTARTVRGRSVGYTPPVQKKNLEVSLVLDVTGSMLGLSELLGLNKLDAMKQASKDLIDIVVQTRQAPYTSRVALTPFSAAVNVDDTYFQTVTNKTLVGQWSSVVERSGSYKFTDDPPSATYGYFRDYKTERSSASGSQGYLQGNQGSNIPANSVIAPLSNDKAALKATIDSYSAKGSTGGQIGLAWGWYQLSPKWNSIFSGTAAPNAYNINNTYKALVMMSDFDFNVYYVEANGDAATQFAALCTNIKNAGVQIFVVGYNVVGSASNTLMRNCASSSDKVYSVDTVSEMNDAFRQIAAQTVAGASEPTLRVVE